MNRRADSCPPCTGDCRQGRGCPAATSPRELRPLRWVLLCLALFWAMVAIVVAECVS